MIFDGVLFLKKVEYEDIYKLLSRTFLHINEKLIIHGNNVAFITIHMLKKLGYTNDELKEICLASLLHDIGAYKKDDLSKLVNFELDEKKSLKHCIYGYAFIKNFKCISKWCDAILFHHTDVKHLDNFPLSLKTKEVSSVIHIADKAEIYISLLNDYSYLDKLKNDPTIDHQYISLLDDFDITLVTNQLLFTSPLYLELLKDNYFRTSDIDEIFRMLTLAIDFKSPCTVSHTALTESIALTLGSMFHLNSDELKILGSAALLHDIGKLAIPNQILESPNRLCDEEFKIMKNHVEYTNLILTDIVDDEVRKIAIRHHEKINGLGYPYGLKGDELSLSDRIIAVSDITSALISKRSYKEPFDKEMIIKILESEASKNAIDYNVVNTLVTNYDFIIDKAKEHCQVFIDMYERFNNSYYQIENYFLNIIAR